MNNKQEVLYIQVLYYRDVLFTNLLQIMFCGFYLLIKVLNLGLTQKGLIKIGHIQTATKRKYKTP